MAIVPGGLIRSSLKVRIDKHVTLQCRRLSLVDAHVTVLQGKAMHCTRSIGWSAEREFYTTAWSRWARNDTAYDFSPVELLSLASAAHKQRGRQALPAHLAVLSRLQGLRICERSERVVSVVDIFAKTKTMARL